MPAPAPAPVRNAPHIGRPLRAADVTQGEDGGLRLSGAECTACGTRIFPAAPVCPSCNAEQLKPLPLGATGTLYAYSTVYVAPAVWQVPDLTVRVHVEEDAAADASAAAPTYRYWFAPA